MPYYKLMRSYPDLHDDLKYWFEEGRPVIVHTRGECSADEIGPENDLKLKLMSNVEVIMAVKKEKALVISAKVPKLWFPDPMWHKRPPNL